MDNDVFIEYSDIIISYLERVATITGMIFTLFMLVTVFLTVYWFLKYIKGFFMP